MEEKVKRLEEWQNNQSQKCTAREIRAIKLEQSMCELKKDIQEIKQNQHEYMIDMTKFREELFEKLDNKYASKWVEKGFAGLVIIMALSALYFIMSAVGLK
jgi:predicted  nucleic acid-binding Zn-ribbon protein